MRPPLADPAPNAPRVTAGDLVRTRDRTLVFLAVLAQPGISVSNISRLTGLSRWSVERAIADLFEEGMIVMGPKATRDWGEPARTTYYYAVPPPDARALALLTKITTTKSAHDPLAGVASRSTA